MPRFPYARLSAYYFFHFAFIGAFSPYFGLYLQSLSFSAWDISVAMSQMPLMRLLGPYLWGSLADRATCRMAVIRWTGLAAFLIFLFVLQAYRFGTLLFTLSLFSFFWVASLPLVETLTLDHLREHPARYSRIRLWGSIGFIVAVMSIGAALEALPLRGLPWINLALLAGITLCGWLVPEAAPRNLDETEQSIGALVRRPRVLALLSACFLMSAAHGALNIFYAIFLAGHGYEPSTIGGLYSLGVLAEILVFLFMARLMRHASLRRILLACFIAASTRFMMIAWGADAMLWLVLAQLLHSLSFGACHSAAIAAIGRWFPGRTQSRGQALYSSASFGAGGLFGGLLSGWSWDSLGGAGTFALSSVYALIGLWLVVVWIPDENSAK